MNRSALTAAVSILILPIPSLADIVHLDDVIIQFSQCVGSDCVNGENFGFDTFRLKENNLRIHFDDTSSSGSFPANDWRIIANDSANGGSNYLAIEDSTAGRIPFRVEAGARANALVVEADGDVGIGTLNPAVDLQIVNGNTPTLRLEQDGSSGFTAQTWDVAGNEANFFVRDVTNGSKLSFRIRPGAPESSIDIAADGDVGMGTSSPSADLHVNGDQGLLVTTSGTTGLYTRGSGAYVLNDVESSTNGAIQWRLKTDSQNRRFIAQNSSGTAMSQILLKDGSIVLAGTTDSSNTFATFDSNGIAVTGAIYVNGNQVHPDYVFTDEYDLPSISDQATYMWKNRHLPAVGQGLNEQHENGVGFNIVQKTMGILEELEKAHIYIEQLHTRLALLEARMDTSQSNTAK